MEFQDAESWQPGRYGKKAEITPKGIMLDYLRKIGVLSAREFRGGFWYDNVSIINGVAVNQQVYVGDAREEFGNAIDWLYDFLFPYFDRKALSATGKVYDKIDALNHADKNYKNQKVKLKRDLFREISVFLHRIDYLESEPYEDEETENIDDSLSSEKVEDEQANAPDKNNT